MRPVVIADEAPEGAVRVVGVSEGEILEDLRVDLGISRALGFNGELGETQAAVSDTGEPVVLVGLGERVDRDAIRQAAGAAARVVPPETPMATSLHGLAVDGAAGATIAGVLCGSYRYPGVRSGAPDQPHAELVLVGEASETEVGRTAALAGAVCRARDWVNMPPADKAPMVLADLIGSRLAAVGFEVEVWDPERLAKERCGGLLAVAAGSDRPACMLVARRHSSAGPGLALVGKGIVFDSGGLSLKTREGMETMKSDMAGAASVGSAAEVIGAVGPGLGVSVFIPLSDNMPGGSALKPGDVIRARNGKTIEVLNTDAEGRLVLADALALAAEESPSLIVDVATLTGAARVALGEKIAAVLGSPAAIERVQDAADHAGERVWPLPLPADYRRLIDSPVADMKNSAGRYGGAITAALLLAEFVDEVPWAHIDIAGPAMFREDDPLGPKGASGFGVTTLVALAGGLAES